MGCIALMLSAAVPRSLAQQDEPPIEVAPLNIAFSAYIASGIYHNAGRTMYIFRVPMQYTLRDHENRAFGIGLFSSGFLGRVRGRLWQRWNDEGRRRCPKHETEELPIRCHVRLPDQTESGDRIQPFQRSHRPRRTGLRYHCRGLSVRLGRRLSGRQNPNPIPTGT
jgi:hypothetical protein